MMDKQLARKNLRFGFSLFVLLLLLVGTAFLWAFVFLKVVN